ncbi:MAG TPA: site-2 protease family protein [Firmicutes bacterium]|nr:site-2 protease family protein [Bacillota bacterium]
MDIRSIILSIPGLVVGVSFHEFAHALAADRLGDPTPRMEGRLTLEPWMHFDIVGTVLLLLYGFGWAKPVHVNPFNFRRPKRDMLLVALAGPLMNLAVAVGCWMVVILLSVVHSGELLLQVLRICASINIGLAAFNILPVPPLDGSKVLSLVRSPRMEQILQALETYGPLLLLLLLISGRIGSLIGGIASFFARITFSLAATALNPLLNLITRWWG